MSITMMFARPNAAAMISQQRSMGPSISSETLVRVQQAQCAQPAAPRAAPRSKRSFAESVAGVNQKHAKSGLDKTRKPVGVLPDPCPARGWV